MPFENPDLIHSWFLNHDARAESYLSLHLDQRSCDAIEAAIRLDIRTDANLAAVKRDAAYKLRAIGETDLADSIEATLPSPAHITT